MVDPESIDDLTGTRLGNSGRILIQEKIGEGGVGVVYKIWDDKDSKTLAMKVLRSEYARDPEVVTRFEREGRRFAKLKHPNILKVYGFGRKQHLTFLVTEFVDGRNLGEMLEDDGAFEVMRGLEICRKVAEACQAAHESQVVHRDLKPENIMVRNADGVVKVLDFGIAKSLDTMSSFTGSDTYLGTPGYSAPEQIQCRGVDGRTDIFSLGAILYEMITGRLAFEGKHTLQILKSTLKTRPIAPTRFNDEIVGPVALLIEKMIKKNPRHRHDDMSQVIVDLDTVKTRLEGGYGDAETGTFIRVLSDIFTNWRTG